MVFQCTQHITYNEGNSVVAERFIKILKGKIYKKWQLMIKNIILVICHCSINKKSIDADYSSLNGKIELRHKASKFKVGERVRITK